MKPVSKGHWALIKRASTENDRVVVFVSTSDRGSDSSDDDAQIKGSDMVEIWERHLKMHLPANVEIVFGGSPIRKIYEMLGNANEKGSVDIFRVYSDPNDIAARFAYDKQVKYFGELVKHKQVEFVGVDRIDEFDVSATQMRKLLKHGMKESFMTLLPDEIDREAVWNSLLLRTFVRNVK